MVPYSGRIKKSNIEIMSKMMSTFTLSYIDSNKIGPAFYVLFTDFSWEEEVHKKKLKCDSDYSSYGEETIVDEKTKNES